MIFFSSFLSFLSNLFISFTLDGSCNVKSINGYGFGWLEIIGGAYKGLFDSNAFNQIYTGADLELNVILGKPLWGWVATDNDPFEVVTVPEPATKVFMGIGLLGTSAFVRRKFKKKINLEDDNQNYRVQSHLLRNGDKP